nr:hypothetical protein [Lentzea terrae]
MNLRWLSSTKDMASAPHVGVLCPRSTSSARSPSLLRLVSVLPRRYEIRLRWSALRALPTVASLDAPLKGTFESIISAMYASSSVDLPVPEAPESSVVVGAKVTVLCPWKPPQLTSWRVSAFHWVVPSVAPAR